MPSVILEESSTGSRKLEFREEQAEAILELLATDVAEFKVYVIHPFRESREFQGKLTFLRLTRETEAVGRPELSKPPFVPGLPPSVPEPPPVPQKPAASDLVKWVGVGAICLFAIILFGVLPSFESKPLQPGKPAAVKAESKQANALDVESETIATLQRDVRDLAMLVRDRQDKPPASKPTPNPSETAKALGELISPVAGRIEGKLEDIRSLLVECKLALSKPAPVQDPVKSRRPVVDFLLPYVEQGQLGVYVFGDNKRVWDYRPDGRVTEFVEFDDAATDRNVCRRLRVASEDRIADRYVRVTFLDGRAVTSKYEHFGEAQVLHKVAVRAMPDHSILAARNKALAQDEPRYVPLAHQEDLLLALRQISDANTSTTQQLAKVSFSPFAGGSNVMLQAPISAIKKQSDAGRKLVKEYGEKPYTRAGW